jgi:lysophospholipase L1-like esterase
MRRAPLALLALFACTNAESPKPGDSGLVDSATALDTADSVDTGDTDTDTGGTEETGDTAEPDDTADSGEPEPEDCHDRLALGNGFSVAPDYASVAATVNSSCTGTDHQNIEGVQRVVFLGDSVTVGTPPNTVERFYRNQVAAWAVSRWGLQEPDYLWGWYDVIAGTGYQMESGDFAVCAKFGGRTDDLMEDNNQIIDCIPEDKAGLTTLVVMTVGGNDLFALADDYYEGVPEADLIASTEKEMQNLRDAVTWITTDKTRFPGKMYVVFANMYEFTDGFGEVEACPGADLVGYHYDLSNAQIAERLAWMQGEMLSIAVDTETDMIFLGEAFCGHGYNADDASGRCYRGADSPLWFDESCFHPNNDGHDAIAGLFQSTIEE